eukprot:4339987-Amphidinium_carterae.1
MVGRGVRTASGSCSCNFCIARQPQHRALCPNLNQRVNKPHNTTPHQDASEGHEEEKEAARSGVKPPLSIFETHGYMQHKEPRCAKVLSFRACWMPGAHALGTKLTL